MRSSVILENLIGFYLEVINFDLYIVIYYLHALEIITNEDGRGLVSNEISPGLYKIVFYSKDYFAKKQIATFYPYIEIVFEAMDQNQHYHIPLLLSPFGYSSYRGSWYFTILRMVDVWFLIVLQSNYKIYMLLAVSLFTYAIVYNSLSNLIHVDRLIEFILWS